jgi:hypothetical protein
MSLAPTVLSQEWNRSDSCPLLAQPDLVPSTAFLTSPEYFLGMGHDGTRVQKKKKKMDVEVQVVTTRICGSDHHFCKHPLKIRQLCFAKLEVEPIH